jgi:hypothetical protein
MTNNDGPQAIGKTSSPFRTPNTTGVFHFWLSHGIRLNPFDFVVAEHFDGSRTVGIVDEIFNYTDSDSHLTDYIGNELGNPSAEPYVDRVSTTVGQANVLRNMARPGEQEELYMPLPTDRRVFFADEEAISRALGFDDIRGISIPAGLITQSNNIRIPVYLDSNYLIGPQGAHANASGISGLATKTSYLMFLLYSMYQRMSKSLCLVIFNVKHSDLLHIDEEPIDLTPEDREMYNSLGFENLRPFENVHYYLPRGRQGHPDTEEPPRNHTIYSYSLQDVHADLDLLFSEIPDDNYTIDAFVHQFRRDWANGRIEFSGEYRNTPYGPTSVETWAQLYDIRNDVLGAAVYGYPSHVTPPRLKRELRRLTTYSAFVGRRSQSEIYLGDTIKQNILPGMINVIDIFRVPRINQPFVIGDVMRSIEELYHEQQSSNLPNVVIFIDELNTFAPSGEKTNPITSQVIEIAQKGRARRMALFGAQQFKSEVHKQVWGNCTLSVFGRTGSAEISGSAYHELPEYTKNSIMKLRHGEIVLSFKIWRAPIKVKFPKPPYLRLSSRTRNIQAESPQPETQNI